MGLFDIFRNKNLPPGDIQTQKSGKKLISKNTDVATRYQSADNLAGIGTEEAIFCLLQRYTVVIGTDIPDEDEKNYVTEKIVSFGSRSIPPLIKFIREKEQVAQALQLLRRLSPEDQFLEHLLNLIDDYDPYYSKYPDKKIQTFKLLQELKDPRICDAVEPFLDDDDDDIRIAALRTLAAQQNEEKTRDKIIESILTTDDRPRVRIAACEAMVALQWKVKGFRNKVESALPERFYLDSKGYIHQKSEY
jgi:HEAT repeat protein